MIAEQEDDDDVDVDNVQATTSAIGEVSVSDGTDSTHANPDQEATKESLTETQTVSHDAGNIEPAGDEQATGGSSAAEKSQDALQNVSHDAVGDSEERTDAGKGDKDDANAKVKMATMV